MRHIENFPEKATNDDPKKYATDRYSSHDPVNLEKEAGLSAKHTTLLLNI